MSRCQTLLISVLHLTIICFTPLVFASENATHDQKLIKGTWQVKEAEVLGKHTHEASTDQKWDITDGKIGVRFGDGGYEEWTYKLDSSTKPPSIDLTSTAGVKKGTTPVGIYELKGDSLRIFFNGHGERPSDFGIGALKGDSRYGRLITFERVKADKPSDSIKEQIPISLPVPEATQKKLTELFKKYYPKATVSKDGLHYEYEITKYEFPYNGPKGALHESPIKMGPKPGGILFQVSVTQGPYRGQATLSPSIKDEVPSMSSDYKVYTLLLSAPYSKKRDTHLWAVLSYPPDASKEFLQEYQEILKDFQQSEK